MHNKICVSRECLCLLPIVTVYIYIYIYFFFSSDVCKEDYLIFHKSTFLFFFTLLDPNKMTKITPVNHSKPPNPKTHVHAY